MAKMGITCNGAETGNIYPLFIFGAAAVASGDDVVMYFTPGGARVSRRPPCGGS